jgi:MarR family 2-MHQ and catechol resistance regulon transcriptional repressor
MEKNKTKKVSAARSSDIEKIIAATEDMYFTRLIALSDIVNRYVNIALKDKVNWLRLTTLIVLTRRGKGTLTPSVLARNLLRPNQNVTAIVDDLERDGYVVKVRQSGDRRMVAIKITKAGLGYIRQSLNRIAFAEKELRFCLNEKELKTIGQVLVKFSRHLVSLLFKDPEHLLRTEIQQQTPAKGKKTKTKL